jgi:hypothetical protein
MVAQLLDIYSRDRIPALEAITQTIDKGGEPTTVASAVV